MGFWLSGPGFLALRTWVSRLSMTESAWHRPLTGRNALSDGCGSTAEHHRTHRHIDTKKKKTLSVDDDSLGQKKKKNPVPRRRQFRAKKKKNPVRRRRQLGAKKKKEKKREVLSVKVLKPRFQDLALRTSHRQMHRLRLFISSIDD